MAATETGDLLVTATLTESCAISAGTLVFGSFTGVTINGPDGTGAPISNVDATSSTIHYACTSGTTAAITLPANDNTDTGQRRMKNGAANFLKYALYSDTNRLEPITTTTEIPASANGATQDLTIYGRITGTDANQPAGAYSDTVLMTITYGL